MIDAAIRALPPVEVPAQLRRRIGQIPIEHAQGWMWPGFSGQKSVWTWALCAAIGAVCGTLFDFSMLSAEPDTTWSMLSSSPVGADAQLEVEDDSLDLLLAQAWTNEWTQALDPAETSPAIVKERAQ